MDTRIDGSVLAVLAAYENHLVSLENDEVTNDSMSRPPKSGKVGLCSARVKKRNACVRAGHGYLQASAGIIIQCFCS